MDARMLAMKILLPGIAALFLPAMMAFAQEDPADPLTPEDRRARYIVELIIFTYVDRSSAGNEVFGPPAPLDLEPLSGGILEEPPVFDDRTLPRPEGPAGDLESSGPLREFPARGGIEFRALEPEAFRMRDAYRKLARLDAYRPILHAAWTQTTQEKSTSPTLPLRTISDPPLGLDGSIRLYQSRFLHLDVDLTLDASGPGRNEARTATDRLVNRSRSDTPGGASDRFPTGPVRYRITEDRIMRDGEIRYFDHPRFGMLARVSRVGQDGNTP